MNIFGSLRNGPWPRSCEIQLRLDLPEEQQSIELTLPCHRDVRKDYGDSLCTTSSRRNLGLPRKKLIVLSGSLVRPIIMDLERRAHQKLEDQGKKTLHEEPAVLVIHKMSQKLDETKKRFTRTSISSQSLSKKRKWSIPQRQRRRSQLLMHLAEKIKI